MSRLHEVAAALRQARLDEKDAKRRISILQPEFFRLLDEEVGEGQVEFEHNGFRFGRIVAEKASFDIERFMREHPELRYDLVKAIEVYELDEEALQDYLAENPEMQTEIAKYVIRKPEARWKNPVEVREEV